MTDRPPAVAPPGDAGARICAECGRTLRPGRDDYLCRGCRWEVDQPDDEYSHQRQQDRARRALAVELGMPLDIPPTVLTLHGSDEGPEWHRFSVEMMGVRAWHERFPPPWPFFRMGPMLYQMWLRRLRLAGNPVYLEVRWHPERGQTIDLRGLSEATSVASATAVLKGLGLLRRLERKGRLPGTGAYPTRQAFLAAHADADESLRRRNVKPRPDLIADELGLSRSRYYDLVKMWPPTRAKRGRSVRSRYSSD